MTERAMQRPREDACASAGTGLATALEAAAGTAGGYVLHARRMPGGRGDIDHTDIVPTGVHVIDTKAVTGKVEVRRPWLKPDQLFIAGRDRTTYLDGLDRRTQAVRDAIDRMGCRRLAVPAGLSILTTTFAEGPARNRALGIWTLCGASGFSLGLVFGGLLTELGWRAPLLMPDPVALLLAAAGWRVIPRAASQSFSMRHFDLPGALTTTGSLLLLVYAVVEGPAHGWASISTLGALALSAALMVSFVVIESASVSASRSPRSIPRRRPAWPTPNRGSRPGWSIPASNSAARSSSRSSPRFSAPAPRPPDTCCPERTPQSQSSSASRESRCSSPSRSSTGHAV
jgi:hypothetical protein